MPRIIGDLDELITSVRHVARSDVYEIKHRTEQEVRRIKEDAREQADQEREEILGRARAQAGEIRRQRAVETTEEKKRSYLQAREELLEEVWKEAEQRLRSLTGHEESYGEALRRLALAAVRAMGPGLRLLGSDPRGHRLLTEDRLEEWSREASGDLEESVSYQRMEEPLDTWGGLVVMEKDGRRRVNSLFSDRLEVAREESREQVFQRLVKS